MQIIRPGPTRPDPKRVAAPKNVRQNQSIHFVARHLRRFSVQDSQRRHFLLLRYSLSVHLLIILIEKKNTSMFNFCKFRSSMKITCFLWSKVFLYVYWVDRILIKLASFRFRGYSHEANAWCATRYEWGYKWFFS